MSPADELKEIRENAFDAASGLAYDIEKTDPVVGDFEVKVHYDDPDRQQRYHDAFIPIGRNARHLQDVTDREGRRFIQDRRVGPWVTPDAPYVGPLRGSEVEYCKYGNHPRHLVFEVKALKPAKEV